MDLKGHLVPKAVGEEESWLVLGERNRPERQTYYGICC